MAASSALVGARPTQDTRNLQFSRRHDRNFFAGTPTVTCPKAAIILARTKPPDSNAAQFLAREDEPDQQTGTACSRVLEMTSLRRLQLSIAMNVDSHCIRNRDCPSAKRPYLSEQRPGAPYPLFTGVKLWTKDHDGILGTLSCRPGILPHTPNGIPINRKHKDTTHLSTTFPRYIVLISPMQRTASNPMVSCA